MLHLVVYCVYKMIPHEQANLVVFPLLNIKHFLIAL